MGFDIDLRGIPLSPRELRSISGVFLRVRVAAVGRVS